MHKAPWVMLGGTRFYFAYATPILLRFYFDFEVESRGAKPLPSHCYSSVPSQCARGSACQTRVGHAGFCIGLFTTQEALPQHARQATRPHHHALLAATLRRHGARTLYARRTPMGPTGSARGESYFRLTSGASVHPMNLKTLNVCM